MKFSSTEVATIWTVLMKEIWFNSCISYLEAKWHILFILENPILDFLVSPDQRLIQGRFWAFFPLSGSVLRNFLVRFKAFANNYTAFHSNTSSMQNQAKQYCGEETLNWAWTSHWNLSALFYNRTCVQKCSDISMTVDKIILCSSQTFPIAKCLI